MSSTGTMDMTKGDHKKILVNFAMPIFFSHLLQQLYNSADSFIVGRYLGENALAAVSSSGPLIFLLISFFTGTSMGAGVVMSRYFGAKDKNKLSKAIHTNITLGMITSTLLTIFGVFMTPTILRLMDVDKKILPQSIEYFRVYFIGISTVVIYNILKSVMNAVGDSKRPLLYLLFSSVFNIILDILFIGVFRMGVGAAALATIISQFASMILCLIHLVKPGTEYQVKISKLGIDKEMFIDICKYGLPTGIQNSVIGFANVLVQKNINSFGAAATAGCGAYSKIEGFAFLPINSFTMAISTYVGQNLGAGKHKRAKDGAKFGILLSMLLAEAIGIVIYIFAPKLIALFSDGEKMLAIGVKQARTAALFYFLLAFSHCIASVCRGAGKAFVPMLVMLGIWCVLRITYITVAMQISHEIGLLFWAYPLTWSISSIIFLIYYNVSDWIHGFDKK